jgi:hypothetical protein
MAIQVRNDTEFKRLVDALAQEIVDGNIFFRLHMDLIAAYEADRPTMREAWTFWSLTMQAHLDAAILRLTKIYDQDDTHLGLLGFLDTVKSNFHLFSLDRFAERIREQNRPDSLVSGFESLDLRQVDADMEYARRASNAIVNRFIDLRHNFYVHRNARDVVEDINVGETRPLLRDEVGVLLTNALQIMNRYSQLYDMNLWSPQMLGRDDFNYVLRASRERLDRLRDESALQ